MSKNKEIKRKIQAKLNAELMMVTESGFPGRVRRLIKKGANVNFISENGKTPLYIAASKGDVKVVHSLLKKGAKNNISKELTPLHIAAISGYLEVVQLLIKGDNDINLNQNSQNQVALDPLYLAIIHKKLNVVKLLLDSGAEVLIKHIPPHAKCEAIREIIKLLIPYLLLKDSSIAKLECIQEYQELSTTWDDSLTQIEKMKNTFISETYNYYDLLKIESNKLAKHITSDNFIELKKVNFNEKFSIYSDNLQKKLEALIILKKEQNVTLPKKNIIFLKKPSNNIIHNAAQANVETHIREEKRQPFIR